jgi:hypothetical protein
VLVVEASYSRIHSRFFERGTMAKGSRLNPGASLVEKRAVSIILDGSPWAGSVGPNMEETLESDDIKPLMEKV